MGSGNGDPSFFFPDRFHRQRYDLYWYAGDAQFSIHSLDSREIPPATLPRHINEYCMATFSWVPYRALPS